MPLCLIKIVLFLAAASPSATPEEPAEKRYYLTFLNGAAIEVTEEEESLKQEAGTELLVTRIRSLQRMRIGPRRMSSESETVRIEKAHDLSPVSLQVNRLENGVALSLSVRVEGAEAILDNPAGPTRLALPPGRAAYFRLDAQVLRALGLLRVGGRLEASVLVPEETGLAIMEAKVEARSAAGYLLKISNLVGSERSSWYEECDTEGRLLRFQVGGMEKRRVKESEARLPPVVPSVSNRVRASDAPAGLLKRREVLLRLEGELPEDITLVPASPYCRVVNRDAAGLTLQLSATYPDGSLPAAELPEVERKAFLSRTALYEVGDGVLLEALAGALAGKPHVSSALSKTVRICRWVNRRISSPGGMPAMSSAVFAIRARRGDCTEYAAATVGLLRTAAIPARMALGLVYDGVGFQFHAWAEAYLDDRWVPVDAAYKRVGLPPVYILLGYGDVEAGLYENRAFRLLSGFRFRFLADGFETTAGADNIAGGIAEKE